MAAVVDNRTPNYDVPLPNAGNWLSEDVIRLAQAITAFDALIKGANDNVAGRALIEHTHQISEISGLAGVLAQMAAIDHVHALAALTDVDVSIVTVGQYMRWNGAKWVPGVVSADDIKAGTIDPARLPAIAITDTYVVASQADMLALGVQKGDIAVRQDLNRSYICSGSNPALPSSWTELLTPTDAVLSVAGLTGAITAPALRAAIATATGIALMTAASGAAARAAIEAAPSIHDHNGLYYTEAEADGRFIRNFASGVIAGPNITLELNSTDGSGAGLWFHVAGVKRAGWWMWPDGRLIYRDQSGAVHAEFFADGDLGLAALGARVAVSIQDRVSNIRWVHVNDGPTSNTTIAEASNGAFISDLQTNGNGTAVTLIIARYRRLQMHKPNAGWVNIGW